MHLVPQKIIFVHVGIAENSIQKILKPNKKPTVFN